MLLGRCLINKYPGFFIITINWQLGSVESWELKFTTSEMIYNLSVWTVHLKKMEKKVYNEHCSSTYVWAIYLSG